MSWRDILKGRQPRSVRSPNWKKKPKAFKPITEEELEELRELWRQVKPYQGLDEEDSKRKDYLEDLKWRSGNTEEIPIRHNKTWRD
tara:strand:- start:960 stop:1217 length:258 start_codon:yes stop_codon:yes gene_type:complete